jgi:hypothetical protein
LTARRARRAFRLLVQATHTAHVELAQHTHLNPGRQRRPPVPAALILEHLLDGLPVTVGFGGDKAAYQVVDNGTRSGRSRAISLPA